MRLYFLFLVWAVEINFSLAHAQSPILASAQLPAFFYQGDQPKIQFLLSNKGNLEQTGNLQLELFDAKTKNPVDGWFYNQLSNQYFTLAAGEHSTVRFPLTIPNLFSGNIHWQLTVRIDSTKQTISGQFEVRATHPADTMLTADQTTAKGGMRLLLRKAEPTKKITEQTVSSFSVQPIGQAIFLKMTIVIYRKLDSCVVLLPLSAGLQLKGQGLLFSKGKPKAIAKQPLNDTTLSMTLYDLAPGTYQWEYQFTTRYPGQFLVPACRLQLFNEARKEYHFVSKTIEID